MLVTRRRLRIIKMFMLSPRVEFSLLVSYSFLILTFLALTSSYSSQAPYLDYIQRKNILEYFEEPSIMGAKDFSEVYYYLDRLITRKLWMRNWPSPYLPIGTLRLAQYRVMNECEMPAKDCYEESCFKVLFDPACNRLYEAGINEETAFRKNFSVESVASEGLLATLQGQEYLYQETNISSFSGIFGSYGTKGYLVDFDKDMESTQFKLSQLEKAGWLDHQTRGICVQWTILNSQSTGYYTSTIFIENPGDTIFETSFKLQNVYLFQNHFDDSSNKKNLFLLIACLLIVNSSFVFVKSIFAISVGYKKLTNIVDVFHVFITLGVVITLFSTVILHDYDFSFTEESQHQFYSFQATDRVTQYETLFIGISCLLFPIKIIQLLSSTVSCVCPSFLHSYSKLYHYQVYVFFRTLPGLFLFLCTWLIILFSWGQGYYLLFSPYIAAFRTYIETVLTLSYRNFNDIAEYAEYKNENWEGQLVFWESFTEFTRLLMFIGFIGLCTYLYSKATSFAKETLVQVPVKLQFQKDVKDMLEKVNQVYAKLKEAKNPTTSKTGLNRRLVLWVTNRPLQSMQLQRDELFNRMKNEHQFLDFIEFETTEELIPFLGSLFQVKPSLLTSVAVKKLRIVTENFKDSKQDHFNNQPLVDIVNYLKDTGCRVPIMIYQFEDHKHKRPLLQEETPMLRPNQPAVATGNPQQRNMPKSHSSKILTFSSPLKVHFSLQPLQLGKGESRPEEKQIRVDSYGKIKGHQMKFLMKLSYKYPMMTYTFSIAQVKDFCAL